MCDSYDKDDALRGRVALSEREKAEALLSRYLSIVHGPDVYMRPPLISYAPLAPPISLCWKCQNASPPKTSK